MEPCKVIALRRNEERAFVGVNSALGTLQHQMMQQFCRGMTLSAYNAAGTSLCEINKERDIAIAQCAIAADPGGNPAQHVLPDGLQANLVLAALALHCLHITMHHRLARQTDKGTISSVIQSTNQSRVPSSRPGTTVHPKGKDTRLDPEHKMGTK